MAEKWVAQGISRTKASIPRVERAQERVVKAKKMKASSDKRVMAARAQLKIVNQQLAKASASRDSMSKQVASAKARSAAGSNAVAVAKRNAERGKVVLKAARDLVVRAPGEEAVADLKRKMASFKELKAVLQRARKRLAEADAGLTADNQASKTADQAFSTAATSAQKLNVKLSAAETQAAAA